MNISDKKILTKVEREGFFKKFFKLKSKQPNATNLGKENIREVDLNDISGISAQSQLGRAYVDYVYKTLHELSKKRRIQEYYQMSFDPEISYALTEIVDEMVREDEDGRLISLKFNKNVSDEVKQILKEEFTNLFDDHLNLNNYNQIWDWAFKFVTQGVIVFKIKYSKEENTGITELEELKTWTVYEKEDAPDYYFIKENEKDDYAATYAKEEIILAHSHKKIDGEYFSILEDAKKDWKKLNLMEDASIIYKLSRSPLRRIFYVYVGKMAPQDTEAFLVSFRERMKQDITYDPQKGEIVGLSPITILDDFFIPVFEGGQKLTEIDMLQEKDTGWENQEEIRYWLGKVYRSLKIPLGRMNIPNQSGEPSTVMTGSRSGEIMRDEIKFSNFIKRIRNRFCEEFLENVFIKHLFYRGLLDKLKIVKNTFSIRFTYENPYSELKNSEIDEFRMNSFQNALNSNELVSVIFAMKKYLRWTEDEIEENFKLKKDEMKILNNLSLIGGQGGAMGGTVGGGETTNEELFPTGEEETGNEEENLTEIPPEEVPFPQPK